MRQQNDHEKDGFGNENGLIDPIPKILPNVILIDGPSGVGKTKTAWELARILGDAGLRVDLFEEGELDPTYSEIATAHDIAKEQGVKDLDNIMIETFVDHRRDTIYPEIARTIQDHDLVIIVRGEVTTAAYQSASGNHSIQEIYDAHRGAEIPLPGAIILLSCLPEEAELRIQGDISRIENVPGRLSGKFTVGKERRIAIHKQYRLMSEFYADHHPNGAVRTVDTTCLSKMGSVESVLRSLLSMGYIPDDKWEAIERQVEESKLLETVEDVSLVGFPDVRPYEYAEIALKELNPNDIWFTAYYLLRETLERVERMDEELHAQGIDIYNLRRVVNYHSIPLAPPVIEMVEIGGEQIPIIIDGAHRIYEAMQKGKKVTCLVITGASDPTPVFPVSFEEVVVTDRVPEIKRRYNPMLPEGSHSLHYRDLTRLGSGGERSKKEIPRELEASINDCASTILESGRANFDVPHTEATVKYMKLILREHPDLDPTVMIVAAYLHDIGYSNLFDGGQPTYDETLAVKLDHMERGAIMAAEMLNAEFGEQVSQDQIGQIVELISMHDKVEEAVLTEAGLVLMEADTLGGFEVASIKPTYIRTELQEYLDRNRVRRVGRFKSKVAIEIAQRLMLQIAECIKEMEE